MGFKKVEIIMDHTQLKDFFKKTFNTVSGGYGHSAMRFFTESAEHVPSYLNLKGDEHVLDVATGTGFVALTVAKKLPYGQVTGIDFSEGMLSQAMKNKNAMGIHNVNFIEMDMQEIDYKDGYFDAATSAFSIFFVEDMTKQISHIAGKVKHGGPVITTTFFDNSFTPLVNLLFARLTGYGIEVPTLAWKRVATIEQCTTLFKEAGLHNVKCELKKCGYFLSNASDWWYIIWNGGFRGLVNQLSQNDIDKFKEEHLAEVEELATGDGIWLEMNILYTVGERRVVA